jgi:hypothetical protein
MQLLWAISSYPRIIWDEGITSAKFLIAYRFICVTITRRKPTLLFIAILCLLFTTSYQCSKAELELSSSEPESTYAVAEAGKCSACDDSFLENEPNIGPKDLEDVLLSILKIKPIGSRRSAFSPLVAILSHK